LVLLSYILYLFNTSVKPMLVKDNLVIQLDVRVIP